MPEQVHTGQPARRPAKEGEAQQGRFPDPPFPADSLPLVDSEQSPGQYAERSYVNDKNPVHGLLALPCLFLWQYNTGGGGKSIDILLVAAHSNGIQPIEKSPPGGPKRQRRLFRTDRNGV